MQIIREKIYNSPPPLWPNDTNMTENGEGSVTIQLIGNKNYPNKVSVNLNEDGETVNKFDFKILPDQFRVVTNDKEGVPPLLISHYLSDFGYYLDQSRDGPWGQYEYLIDLAGCLEYRAKNKDNPVFDYFFKLLSAQFQRIVVDTAAMTVIDDREQSLEELVVETGLPDEISVRFSCGMSELNRLPLSKKTRIPKKLKEMGLSTGANGFVEGEETLEGTHMSIEKNETQDIVAATLTLPHAVKYFKFNGNLSDKCLFEFTGRGELPGPYVEDYLKENYSVEVANTPRVNRSDTDINLIDTGRSLIANLDETEQLQLPSNESYVETLNILLKLVKLSLYVQEVAGEERFLKLINDLLDERTDEITVDDLHNLSLGQFEKIGALVALAIQNLDKEEKDKIKDIMDRKDLNEIDSNNKDTDNYAKSIGQELVGRSEGLIDRFL